MGEVERRLPGLVTEAQVSPEAAERAGAAVAQLLAADHLTSAVALQGAVMRLIDAWPQEGSRSGMRHMVGAAVAEHTSAVQRQLLDQQEAIHRAAIQAREGAERALRASEARFRALFSDAAVGIGIGDMRGTILEANPALQGMLGYTLAEMRERTVGDFMHPEDAPEVWSDYQALVTGERDSFQIEKRFWHKSGRVIWTNLTVSLIRDDAGSPSLQVAVMQDVTPRYRLQERLRHAATHDPLTGLPNRTLFLERLTEVTSSPPPGHRVGLCFVDLDGFKMINDSRGHLVGDRVLGAVARRLTDVVADEDCLLARLGGDEFVVLLGGSHERVEPVALADRMLASFHEPFLMPDEQPITVQASIGVVELPADTADAEALLQAADLALHAAKEDGRDRVATHDPGRTSQQLTRFTAALGLPGAIERGELTVAYQPMIRLQDGALHGVEALLRWQHPVLGELSPSMFVPIAEDSRAIVAIGRWVLHEACRTLLEDRWPSVNINVSMRQLYSPTFVDEVRAGLGESGIAPCRLRFEVTESVIMNRDDPGPITALRAIADLGVLVVMDDFGTGYSNLAALGRLPLHELKLAGTFLESVEGDDLGEPADLRILGTVVDLAHNLGLTVTAEGVETSAQDRWIRRLGCDVGQGWYYASAAPLPL